MDILSEEPDKFCSQLDAWAKGIISQQNDAAFFTLYVTLIGLIRSNPLSFGILDDLERQVKERKDQLNCAALNICEIEWKILWRYHREWKFRRRLVEIRRLVARPAVATRPFIYQIVSMLNDLKKDSWIYTFLEKISFVFLNSRFANDFSNLSSLKMKNFWKKEEAHIDSIRPFRQKLQKRNQLHKKLITPFSKYTIEMRLFLLRLSIPGKTFIEQHMMLHYFSENDPIFLWGRIKFLESCFQPNEPFFRINSGKQLLAPTNTQKWLSAIEKTDQQISFIAKMELKERGSPLSEPSKLTIEYQIHRKDFESHLQILVNYIKKNVMPFQVRHCVHQENRIEINFNQNITVNNSLQYKEEQNITIQKETLEFTVASLQEAAVITHAKAFWSNHPQAKHAEVYADYSQKHPQKARLLEDRWGEIIRERGLDPRPNSEKKRGKDRKPRQKELY